ncbi:hypothetical protein GCM10010191_57240 [Actinomadura vinacea]|uniref:non-specific serine/threonine protein kinase n=1 Tax=Actinomadura vinacea TaxID=115336 RepID=A0ABP5WTD7_9ACTN
MSDWRLDGYTEVAELGRGAQGRVVLARRGTTGSYVAIKYMTGDGRRVPSRDEARLMASVDDPHVARLYELVEGPDGVAIVMEAVKGVSLWRLLREHGRLEPEAALLVLKGSLLGLAAAHRAGVVHRDYKPGNVIVQGDGASKLIDFGVATRAGQGGLVGTPAYMAPEQWSGAPAGPATDVYAATCVFFECVTGRPPYGGDDPLALMAQHATAAVPVEAVPEPLRGLVAHGMAKDPAVRPAEAGEFVRELEEAATEAYGDDWERRGALVLAAGATALAALFPHALATGTAVSGAAGGGAASSMIGQSTIGGGRRAARNAAGRAGGHAGRVGRTQLLATAAVASVVVIAASVVALVLYNMRSETEPVELTKPKPSATSPAPVTVPPSPGVSESPAASATPPGPSPAAGSTSPAPTGSTSPSPGPSSPGARAPNDGVTPSPVVSTRPPPVTCPRVTQAARAFGPVDVGGTTRETIAIAWNACYDASRIRVEGAEAFARQPATTCPPASGTSCTVTVVYNPRATTSDAATLTIPDRDGATAVTVPLRGTARASDCFPYQSTRDLGAARVGRTVERNFVYPWRVCDDERRVAVVGGGGQFTVTLTACPPAADGGDCGFRVRFTPTGTGARSATMVIPSDTGGRAVDITLTGTGTGTGEDTEGGDGGGEGDGGEGGEGGEGQEPTTETESTETDAAKPKPDGPGKSAPEPTPSPSPSPSPSPTPSPEPKTAKPEPEPSTTAPEPVLEQAPQAKATPTGTG